MANKNINFLYWIFRPFIVVIWRVYYRIYLKNGQFLKLDKPTLIIANHSNSVVDPVAIAVLKNKGFYFLPRGDVFNSPFKKWLLWQFHMIPIFRREEGIENMHKNEETFKRIYGLLNKKKPVIIFSEGKCIQEKRQRSFRKGTARIAFEFDELYKKEEELEFLPIALNYHHWNKFNSDLFINVGEPFKLSDLHIDYKTDKAKAINVFNQAAEKRLKDLMVIIDQPELDGMELDVEELYADSLLNTIPTNLNKRERFFILRKRIAEALSLFYVKEKDRALKLKTDMQAYQTRLRDLGIRDRVIQSEYSFVAPIYLVFLSAMLPIHFTGFIGNYLPYKIPIAFADKKIKLIEFYSTVVLVLSLVTFIIWYSLLFGMLSAFTDNYLFALIFLPLIGISGWVSYKWWRLYKITYGRINLMFLKIKQQAIYNDLKSERLKIKEELDYFSKKYFV